ncbi:MAG: hypothetical protein JJU10_06465 [Idiomarina sp.]|nr:hypothetical protein [Idiomarina sp.]
MPQDRSAAKRKRTAEYPPLIPAWLRIMGWSLVGALAIAWGLPLLYEIYVWLTPTLAPDIEARMRQFAERTAMIFALVVFVLGILVGLRRWQWMRKRRRLREMIQAQKKRKLAEQAQNRTSTEETP